MTPYYEDDHCTIYHGDCRDVLPELSDVGLVITSPPYNLGRGLDDKPAEAMHNRPSRSRSSKTHKMTESYDEHDDALPLAEYRDWQHEVLRMCWESLGHSGAIFYNHKPRVQAGRCQLPTVFVPEPEWIRQVIIWDRVSSGLSFVPSAYCSRHEWIILLARESFRLKSRSESAASDVWSFPPEQGRNDHPCPFPIELPARILETVDVSGPVVDPFMGSGTVLRAAKDRGLSAIGVDRSERYCEIAAKRLAQEVLPP